MSNEHNLYLHLLTALETIRDELKEIRESDLEHAVKVAKLEEKISSLEAELEQQLKKIDKIEQNNTQNLIKNAESSGANKVKWGIIGTLATLVLGSLVKYFFDLITTVAN